MNAQHTKHGSFRGISLAFAFTALFCAATALSAEPSATVTSVSQRYPWNNKVDIGYSLTLDPTHQYGLKFNFARAGTTYPVIANVTISPKQSLSSYSGTYTVDLTTQVPALVGIRDLEGVTVSAVLVDMDVPAGGLERDWSDGVTFIPGDYLVLNLSSGAITEYQNVQSASQFNSDTYKKTMMVFRKVPAGRFRMQASDTVNQTDKPVAETTASSGNQVVTISDDYYISVFECTRKQYYTLSGTTKWPRNPPPSGDTYPASNLMWTEVTSALTTFNNNKQLGSYTLSLPNEAQWERAARAGATTKYFFGSATGSEGDYMWYSGNSGKKAQIVGKKKPNAWGLYDVQGNIMEMCTDIQYNKGLVHLVYWNRQPGGANSSESASNNRVTVGGHHSHALTEYTGFTSRTSVTPNSPVQPSGFRLVLNPNK